MKMVERANRALTSLYFDCLTTMQNDKKALGISGATGISIGVIASSLSVALATEGGDDTITGLGTKIASLLSEIYTTMFSVITVLTAILVVAALVVRMNANQQRAAQATQWLVRIIVCYVAINCIGLLLNIIKNTTTDYGYKG